MSILTDAIAPILAELAVARTDWIEFKAIKETMAGHVTRQKNEVDRVRVELDEKNDNALRNKIQEQDLAERLKNHEDYYGFVLHRQRVAQSVLETAEIYYIGLENSLKLKILEVSGGDASLFATYVPVRPGAMSEQQPSPSRQLANDGRLAKEIAYYEALGFVLP